MTEDIPESYHCTLGIDYGRNAGYPVNVREAVENLRSGQKCSRHIDIVCVDPGHDLTAAIGEPLADCVIHAVIGFGVPAKINRRHTICRRQTRDEFCLFAQKIKNAWLRTTINDDVFDVEVASLEHDTGHRVPEKLQPVKRGSHHAEGRCTCRQRGQGPNTAVASRNGPELLSVRPGESVFSAAHIPEAADVDLLFLLHPSVGPRSIIGLPVFPVRVDRPSMKHSNSRIAGPGSRARKRKSATDQDLGANPLARANATVRTVQRFVLRDRILARGAVDKSHARSVAGLARRRRGSHAEPARRFRYCRNRTSHPDPRRPTPPVSVRCPARTHLRCWGRPDTQCPSL